tara:strand:+ start:251 stop:1141 length:891 start_codon:yes stop_codon:yes gene_type:complete
MEEEEIPKYNPFDNPKVNKGSLMDFALIAKKSEIDLGEVIKHPPIAISIGTYEYKGESYPTPFGSYGDISCIVGASKSKKTFYKSALLAGYVGGNSINYFDNIKGHNSRGKWVIDIDTEQSRFHSQRTFRRVQEMTGINNPYYRCFYLREYSPAERMKFIEWLLNKSEYAGNIGLVSIDGYADLVTDFNNIDQASDLSGKLMKWSSEQNCHITGVLHRNFGTQKPVGHVGSFILKKAETVVFIESDAGTGIVNVKCEYSRNRPFEDVNFDIDDNALPFSVSDPVSNIVKGLIKPAF